MAKHNADNERIKRKYFIFLKEAKRQDTKSIDPVAAALSQFEGYTKQKDFKTFCSQQAVGFKNHLAKQTNQKTGKPLSKATLNSTLRHLKGFFEWLSRETGYKSKVDYSDAEYFNLSGKDARIATAKREKSIPTIEQIKHVVSVMPVNSDIEQRNRALMAFTLLTGARDGAIISLKLKHIDFSADCIMLDAREVKTKFSKTFKTYFFPVGDDMRGIVFDWVDYLKNELLFGNDAPLFPKTKVVSGRARRFHADGLTKEHWSNATPIRKVFKQAFEAAGLEGFNPHSFRNTLIRLGQTQGLDIEQFKAWSQNIGHDGVMTSLTNYGHVDDYRQSEIFQGLKNPRVDAVESSADAIAEAVIKKLQNQVV